jgi:SAM-dependent methyltransferase
MKPVPKRESESQVLPTSSDVLLANQLFYGVEADKYDQKNHVRNPAIRRYYERLLNRYVFDGRSDSETGAWAACDVGCGTGFLESLLESRVGSIVAIDATHPMLVRARQKFPGKRVTWVQADAHALPAREAAFDLVCSNAMLHHVFGFEQVLSRMISMLKPGGKLFLGYEPNAIPYRVFWPLLRAAAKIVPEHRDRDRIRQTSGQELHPRLRDIDIHELSEFHIFHGRGERGIHPSRLQQFIAGQGIVDSRVHFSSLYQFALLRDSGLPIPVASVPDWIFRLLGPLSLSFCLTGTKVSQES